MGSSDTTPIWIGSRLRIDGILLSPKSAGKPGLARVRSALRPLAAHTCTARQTRPSGRLQFPKTSEAQSLAVSGICACDRHSRSRKLHRSGKKESGTALRWRKPLLEAEWYSQSEERRGG